MGDDSSKKQDKNGKKDGTVRFSVTLTKDVYEALEKKRGWVPRSRYINESLREKFEADDNDESEN